MKNIVSIVVLLVVLLVSCEPKKPSISSINPVNWEKRSIQISETDSTFTRGSSYLSVYSEIYSVTEERTHDLTVTVSIRNISSTDSVFLFRSEFYDTHGKVIRSYFDHPIFIEPLETVEIVIDEADDHGGTGGNFIFDWAVRPGVHDPYF